MPTFVFFVIAVVLYLAFLLWCFAPLFRRARRRSLGVLRVMTGVLLLGANVFPPLAWPILLPVAAGSELAAERVLAVVMFARTLPVYVANMRDFREKTATVVDILYPLEIAGAHYAPVITTACTRRRMLSLDKGIEFHLFEDYPTAAGGGFLALADSAVVSFDPPANLCSMAFTGRLQPGPFPDYRTRIGWSPVVYVVRGEADNTQLYELQYHAGPVAADDIVLQPPQINRISQAPARDVMPLDSMWPMARRGEMSMRWPFLIEAYQRLPAGVNACVLYVTASMDFKSLTPQVQRTHRTNLRDIAPAERPNFCRAALQRHIPPFSAPRLAPAAG
jgi:hypothetical protein